MSKDEVVPTKVIALLKLFVNDLDNLVSGTHNLSSLRCWIGT